MKTAAWMGLALLSLAVGSGCTPSPDKVCTHMMGLAEDMFKEMAKDLPKKDKDPEKEKEQTEKFKKKCVDEMEKAKTEHPDDYKCAAKCIMDLKSFKDLESCEDKCPGIKDKKKKKSGDDDGDDGDKKKKKSDDDDDDKKKKKKKSDDE